MSKICDFKCLDMNKRVDIQSVTSTSDNQGGFTESWTTDASVWAEVKPIKGYLKFQAAQNQQFISHQIIMRYRTGLTARNRLIIGSRIFIIKEIINIEEANAFLKITALEKT